jgi:3-hydroxyisobutyrate dehydrogenase-like beta-hydroxyacid dehydrogenase
MVPKGPHVKDVFMNEETGLLSIGKTSRSILFMECSTIDVATSLEVREAAIALGHRFVDAPVSGGVNGAYNASLTFMIGGK